MTCATSCLRVFSIRWEIELFLLTSFNESYFDKNINS